MIKTFKHKGLEDFFFDGTLKKIQPKPANRLALILDLLDAAQVPRDVRFPGSDLHLLKPPQDGVLVVKISRNWRVTFVFGDDGFYNVDYLDYH